jgi:hypothetical protein|tara:strand:+ start:313 stop:459 length:147 start_codon:yes stop_codon:yes gene_type:complete
MSKKKKKKIKYKAYYIVGNLRFVARFKGQYEARMIDQEELDEEEEETN